MNECVVRCAGWCFDFEAKNEINWECVKLWVVGDVGNYQVES